MVEKLRIIEEKKKNTRYIISESPPASANYTGETLINFKGRRVVRIIFVQTVSRRIYTVTYPPQPPLNRFIPI